MSNDIRWLGPYLVADDVTPSVEELTAEIERLREYEKLVHFIARDYYELSYEKAQWQRDDWKKRCENLIAEDWKE